MKIENCTMEDIDDIFRLYKQASVFQRSKKKVVVWPDFKKELVENEIAEKRQFKMLIEGEIACLWAISFSDAQIWEEKNSESAIYIHRIATNADFRGNNFVLKIVDWAKEYAKSHNKRFVRLDTLGNNTRLIAHYKNAGFNFLGMYNLKNTNSLPEHYHNTPACLFEIDTEKILAENND